MTDAAPRARRGSARSSAPRDPIERLRTWAWTWLARAATPIGDVMEQFGAGSSSAPDPEVASLGQPAPRASKRAAAGEGAAERVARRRVPRDPVARLRLWAWTWLKGPESKAARVAAEVAAAKAAAKAAVVREPTARERREERARVLAFRRSAWTWLKSVEPDDAGAPAEVSDVARAHLKCVLEALVFASETPLSARELAKLAKADGKLVRALLAELVVDYRPRGFRLDEIGGGFVFRTSPAFAPFVREQVAKRPVRMTRAQIETLAIVAYRQPITRPEIDDVRGVDSGAVLKSLLERDLVRIIGKKEEPGRPILYGTTSLFLEFFGLKALADLPTLKEFTELNDDSRRTY
ncbi:MAG TPA: SMC-Scp complex subunit ScpB, partial [Byssovorax sp.]